MRRLLLVSAAVIGLAAMVGPAVIADDDDEFSARMNGYREVASVSTVASGRIETEIDDGEIRYELSYRNLEANSTAAHIHFGQPDVNGGVSAFLCGGGDKPPCPVTSGTVKGTIDAADVIGPANQGIEPGAINELIRAMRAGVTYANVHSTKFPNGEIRGNLLSDDDDDD